MNPKHNEVRKDKIRDDLTEIYKEEMLKKFLKFLDENVFVKSTDSVTGEENTLEPIVEDMEAVIAISGEWDREDLKNILYNLSVLTPHTLIPY